MKMDERKQKILKAIVQDYITTAEPVGSRTISRKFDLGVSPATIRNEMADLEEMGLIEQPHTSAGRVPSQTGYRFYVDYLMDPFALSPEIKMQLTTQIEEEVSAAESLFEHAVRLVSQMTNWTSVVLSGKSQNVMEKLYFLPYKEGQAIMVTVMDNGAVENTIVDVGDGVSADELQLLANLFNEKISKQPIRDLKKDLMKELHNDLLRQRRLIDYLITRLEQTIADKEDDSKPRLYLSGVHNILTQPEFKNLDRIKELLEVFEEHHKLKELLHQDGEGLRVLIGAENQEDVFRDCSVISATYHIDGHPIGSFGILGPTRMDYRRAIAVVNHVTATLTDLLTKRY